MVELAKAGRRVVRLKSGDPMIFGRAGEEIAALDGEGIPLRRRARHHRGLAMAAALGVSLTHRDHAKSVRFVTGHSKRAACPRISTGARSPIPRRRPSSTWAGGPRRPRRAAGQPWRAGGYAGGYCCRDWTPRAADQDRITRRNAESRRRSRQDHADLDRRGRSFRGGSETSGCRTPRPPVHRPSPMEYSARNAAIG